MPPASEPEISMNKEMWGQKDFWQNYSCLGRGCGEVAFLVNFE
jgi:hypothetical protein